jgi:hypothetical protein
MLRHGKLEAVKLIRFMKLIAMMINRSNNIIAIKNSFKSDFICLLYISGVFVIILMTLISTL